MKVADRRRRIDILMEAVERLQGRVDALERHIVDPEGFYPDGGVAAGIENLDKALMSGRLAPRDAWKP